MFWNTETSCERRTMGHNIVVEDAVSYLCYLAYFFAMYGVVCVKQAHSSWGDREDIFLTHLIIINKSEVPIFLVFVILAVAVWLRLLYHHMLLVSYIFRESPVVQMIKCIIARWLYLFMSILHYFIMITMQTYMISKIFVRYILSSVCLRLSRFSQLSCMQYMGLYVFVLIISLMMIVRIRVRYLDIIIKSEVWPIYHGFGLGHETISCATCTYRTHQIHTIKFCYCLVLVDDIHTDIPESVN